MATISLDPRREESDSVAEAAAPWRFRHGWAIVLVVGLCLVSIWLGQSVLSAVHASREHRCKAHLQLLRRGFDAYHQEHGHFPAPYTTDHEGRPLLSWRVTLLPHLGRRDLFDRFHHDEPWDSPHNRALLPEIPKALVCPEAGGFETGFLVVVGPKTDLGSLNTPFEPGRGVDRREITDGTSQVILVAEAERRVPWTCPDDLAFGPGRPLPRLGERHPSGPSVLMADGTVRSLPPTILPQVFRAVLSINGGEVVDGGAG
ncbi:MAG: DUF1559 domain-containing protein [Isosphaeraceae bacterium]